MSEAKQVIVMKKFPSLRTGKYVAQGAHAAMGALLSMAKLDSTGDNLIIPLYNHFVKSWLTGRFKKVALYVETDEELISLFDAAKKAGLPVALIKDAGLTEFSGVPTLTAVGIGPGDPDEIDKITGHLKLF
jgi:PTH2 family peptidyl-tRNA hydrolase